MKSLFLIRDTVKDTISNDEGKKLYLLLSSELKKNNTIELSLHDSTPMSTSFLNSSFGALVSEFGLEVVRKSIKLTNYKHSYAIRLKEYFDHFEVKD